MQSILNTVQKDVLLDQIISGQRVLTPEEIAHELENPQLMIEQIKKDHDNHIQNININNNPIDFVDTSESVEMIEEHLHRKDETNEMTNIIDEMSTNLEIEQNELILPVEAPKADLINNIINNNGNDTQTKQYPIIINATREEFNKLIGAMNIAKSFRQTVQFEKGIATFLSDNQMLFCKIDSKCNKFSSLIFPQLERQCPSLSFLAKSDYVTITIYEDDYIFDNGKIKFQLRKGSINDSLIKSNTFDIHIQNIRKLPHIATYEFSQMNNNLEQLTLFLQIIKGLKIKDLSIYTDKDKNLLFDQGDINIGKFEVLNIDKSKLENLDKLPNNEINAILDISPLSLDYMKLVLEFYYTDEDEDSIEIIISGTLNNGYDVLFNISTYRDFRTQ